MVSSTENASNPDLVWFFSLWWDYSGFQGVTTKFPINEDGSTGLDYGYNTIAVRTAEVSAVPVPSSVWLLGSAFISLVGFRKKINKE